MKLSMDTALPCGGKYQARFQRSFERHGQFCHSCPQPSHRGSLKASEEDKKLTQKLAEGGELLDIKILDHIILSRRGYYSFADEGLI